MTDAAQRPQGRCRVQSRRSSRQWGGCGARVIRRFQPYNHWPAERVAQWQADAADASPQEKQWIADNVKPPPKVPLAARIGFALAVIVSSPVWWSILTGYVAGLAKFVK